MNETTTDITDADMAALWCHADSPQGVFRAPCGTLTVRPGMRTFHKVPDYQMPAEAAAGCDQWMRLFAPPLLGTPLLPAAATLETFSKRVHDPLPTPSATPSAKGMVLQILRSTASCDVPGCEAWRTTLQGLLADLGDDCPQCERNTAFRQVLAVAVPAMTAFLADHPDYRLPDSIITQSSTP